MYHLQEVLSDYFKGSEKQTDFAERNKIERGMLNRAVKGTKRAGADLAARIIGGLPAEWQAKAAVAWLKDQTWASIRESVLIFPNESVVREEPSRPELPEALAADVRSDIIWLAERALIHPEVRQLVAALRKALTSQKVRLETIELG